MKSKLFAILILSVFALSSVLFVGTASAWEKDNIKIVPALKVEERWDSNIFLDPSDEKDDFITILTPSIFGEYSFGSSDRHKAKVDYKVDLGMFGKYHDQNYGNHDVLGELELNFNDYTLTVSDNFLYTSSRAGTEFENRNLRKENTGKVVLGADYNKFAFDVGYSNYLVYYHSDTLESLNRHENSVWGTGYVQVMPKTKALLEYMYRRIDYPDASGRDANVHAGMVGVTGDLTSKITGTTKVGYKYKGYVDSSRDDFSGFIAHTSLSYDPTDRVNVFIAYEREPFESIYANNNYYTGDHVTAAVNYKFGGGFIAKVDGKYFYNAYPEVRAGDSKKRKDHIWGAGAGLDYFWKEWLVAGVGYEFNQRASNINSRDYDQHIIKCDVKVMF